MILKIRNFLLKNATAKLVCLLVALGLWAWVKVQQTAERQFDAVVEYRNLPENLVVTPESDRKVSVVLSGPKSTLNSIGDQEVRVEIDASPFEPGENMVRILPWNLEYPRGLKIESIQPPRVNVVLEERVRKTVSVRPRVESPPPAGFEFQAEPIPDTATIFGPGKVLEDLEEIELEPVDLSERDTGFVQHGVPANIPQGVEIQYPSPNEFSIDFDIYEPTEQRRIENVPVTVLNVPPDRETVVEPKQLDLLIKGPRRRVQEVTAEQIQAEVRAPEGEEPVIRQARIQLPGEIELASGQQDRLTVRVHFKDSP